VLVGVANAEALTLPRNIVVSVYFLRGKVAFSSVTLLGVVVVFNSRIFQTKQICFLRVVAIEI
jgi:hypothetical protein